MSKKFLGIASFLISNISWAGVGCAQQELLNWHLKHPTQIRYADELSPKGKSAFKRWIKHKAPGYHPEKCDSVGRSCECRINDKYNSPILSFTSISDDAGTTIEEVNPAN